MRKFIILLALIALIIGAFSGTIMSNVEQAKYTTVKEEKNIDLREYAPMILAEIEVSGERKPAIQEGFKKLASYIFGSNSLNQKIAMTAPVMQEKESDKWKIAFVMPSEYTLETLPKPKSEEISLISTPSKKMAAIRFSGLASDEMIKTQREKLEAYMESNNLESIGSPILAFYNPPWTLPFLRRNEVIIEYKD
jgi:effector-binding domain-containing protein